MDVGPFFFIKILSGSVVVHAKITKWMLDRFFFEKKQEKTDGSVVVYARVLRITK